MNRRHFIQVTTGALVAGVLAGPASALGQANTITLDALHAAKYRKRRRFVKTSFGDIAYLDEGRAGRVALFLHGFPLNGFQWRGVIDRLSMYRRCIAPDFLAMGHSRVAEGQDVGPDAQVAMLIALLDALSIDAVDLVANDSGGAIAQLLVVRHPERVRSVLLTNCDSEIDSPPAALRPVIELSKQGKFADEWLAPWLADKNRARSATGLGGMCFSDPAQPTDEAIDMYLAPLLASPRRKALVHRYAIALERNALAGIEADLKRSTIPARIAWGMKDDIFAPAGGDYLARTFGASRGIARIAQGKLFWPEEHPDIVAREAIALWNVSLLCPDAQCASPRTGDQLSV
ncbi:MAG: alpha/beta hydrolase [Sphingomonas bacterium]|uniref:alpha/beta fold hydrolase n=1 Tax=Sphingomonas bacterium TaxID=1895847 RepID=UPI0026283E15|nr:alpha/beta hydrolase [Sphingomonas bacterium]MDB5704065.1 alpha/beta hydrolase [Sphingomonas bacterium]